MNFNYYYRLLTFVKLLETNIYCKYISIIFMIIINIILLIYSNSG